MKIMRILIAVMIVSFAVGSYADEVKKEDINEHDNGMPIGTVVAFAGPAVLKPDGWVICDGSDIPLDNNKFKELHKVIGNYYGGTPGVSFKLPNLKGMFVRGLNNEAGGIDANRKLGTTQSEDMKAHKHTISGLWLRAKTDRPMGLSTGGDSGAGASVKVNVGATGGTETRPANVAMNYIIKYRH